MHQPTGLPSSHVIHRDAATVLLQWAVGGMFFCWFTTRRREVGLGYGWLLRGTYGLLALGAAVAGFRYGSVPVREAGSIGVVVGCTVGLGVSIARRRAGVSGQRLEHDRRSERVAAMTGIDRAAERSVDDGGPEFPPVLDLVPVALGAPRQRADARGSDIAVGGEHPLGRLGDEDDHPGATMLGAGGGLEGAQIMVEQLDILAAALCLEYLQIERAYCATLETCALPNLGYTIDRYLGPGEIVLITPEGCEQLKAPGERM